MFQKVQQGEKKVQLMCNKGAITCNTGAIKVQKFTNGVTHKVTVEFSMESKFLIGFQLSSIRCNSGAIKWKKGTKRCNKGI